MTTLTHILRDIEQASPISFFGQVVGIKGLTVMVRANFTNVFIGTRCTIGTESIANIAEVTGFDETYVYVMTYHTLSDVALGASVRFYQNSKGIYPDDAWIGRVISPLIEPLDKKGRLLLGDTFVALESPALCPYDRGRVNNPIDVGVRAINTLLTCCEGQRMGIFAGSGVGKSILLSMLATKGDFDVCVIGLIGERGKEVREFLEDTLKEEGLKKSVMVVSTSNDPPLMRRQAAYTTLSICEYFRDKGKKVLCVIDSITRFAMAMREIGLSVFEPPTMKGYPPSAFANLAKLLERAGPGTQDSGGSITAFISVLVDGDDHNEPIADTVRGILDGHIVLSRDIAATGRFPAIDLLKSISRALPGCHNEGQRLIVKKVKKYLSLYENIKDLVTLGAYQKGSSQEIDDAIELNQKLAPFFTQAPFESSEFQKDFDALKAIIEPYP